MLNWLLKIDPTVAFSVLVGVATWTYHKLAGKKADAIEDIVGGAVRAILAEVADKVPANVPIETYLKGARDYIEQRIWRALEKRGVPKNGVTMRLVNGAIEQATARLAERIANDRAARSDK